MRDGPSGEQIDEPVAPTDVEVLLEIRDLLREQHTPRSF
jgi:hypothetical protein